MIVVKVFMWPGGDEGREVEFGRMLIANEVATTQATSGARGDYSVEAKGGVYGRDDLLHRTWKKGSVKDFDRANRGAWDLLFLALRSLVGGRNR